jgi:hypothetical protein
LRDAWRATTREALFDEWYYCLAEDLFETSTLVVAEVKKKTMRMPDDGF